MTSPTPIAPVRGVLTLMFSTTGTLASYEHNGSFPRFIGRLQAYCRHFEEVHICTADSGDYTPRLPMSNAFHHPMPPRLAFQEAYHLLGPWLHRKALRRTTVVRTFNISGALPAFFVRALSGAPVLVSYGYSMPNLVRFKYGRVKSFAYRLIERMALHGSDRILAATPTQVERLGRRYGAARVDWIPNSVDTERFRPGPGPRGRHLLFVGRFSKEKNLPALFRALAAAGVQRPLTMVGRGAQEDELRALAASLGLRVAFTGTIPNDALPEVYNEAFAFVLPSLFEGMPKVLLEAMACGTPCLGTDVEGIRDFIEDGTTGLLAPPTVSGLAKGLRRLEDDALRPTLGAAARRYVETHFAFDAVLRREIELLQRSSCA